MPIRHAVSIFLVVLATPLLYSQEITGSITGEVRDTSGAMMPNVKVTVVNIGTNVVKTVTTGPSGTYRVPFLIFGRYAGTAELQGFKVSRTEKVRVSTRG